MEWQVHRLDLMSSFRIDKKEARLGFANAFTRYPTLYISKIYISLVKSCLCSIKGYT